MMATAQSREALERANEVREARAQIKRDLREGRIHVAPLLQEPIPQDLGGMRLWDLLKAVPMLGSHKITRILVHCGISSSITVGRLSDRQRAMLARELQGR